MGADRMVTLLFEPRHCKYKFQTSRDRFFNLYYSRNGPLTLGKKILNQN